MFVPPIPASPPQKNATGAQVELLKEASIQLETSFLTEMLKSAGVGKTPEGFGGGAGEDQFGSFLLQAQAEQMARAGALGLAQVVFESLMERTNA